MFAYDVENPDCIDTRRNLFFSYMQWTISGRTEQEKNNPLHIDQHILKEAKMRRKMLLWYGLSTMGAYYMIPQT